MEDVYSGCCSWGLSLFVLFEPADSDTTETKGSWGLSLFVLFEHNTMSTFTVTSSWGLSLFVLFELQHGTSMQIQVLED